MKRDTLYQSQFKGIIVHPKMKIVHSLKYSRKLLFQICPVEDRKS